MAQSAEPGRRSAASSASQDYAMHQACWSGDLQELARLLHLEDPGFVEQVKEREDLLLPQSWVVCAA